MDVSLKLNQHMLVMASQEPQYVLILKERVVRCFMLPLIPHHVSKIVRVVQGRAVLMHAYSAFC